MSLGGSGLNPPQNWGFMPTGPTKVVPLAASTVTVTLSQFVTSAPYAPQAMFWNIDGSGVAGTVTTSLTGSVAFAAFGANTITVTNTTGVPIVPLVSMFQAAAGGVANVGGEQILSTGKRPNQYCVIGSAGTTTVWITPGEGSR